MFDNHSKEASSLNISWPTGLRNRAQINQPKKIIKFLDIFIHKKLQHIYPKLDARKMKIPNLDPSESDSLYQKYLHIKYTTEQEEYTQLIPKQNF